MNKTIKKLFSMKTALTILALLLVACILGSIIPQQSSEAVYKSQYASWAASCILALNLDDVFHSWWFVILTIFLCVNLLGCNLLRFKVILKQYKGYTMEHMPLVKSKEYKGDPKKLLESLGFHHIQEKDGKYYANKNTIGVWGAWLTHLGMLIVIIGFALGQMFTQKYTVYGVPGETKLIDELNYSITFNSFEVGLREDETVEQYTTIFDVEDLKTNEHHEGTVSVNHPTTIEGMKFYQNSTGWASTIEIYKNGEKIQSNLLYAGEYVEVEQVPGLIVLFRSFYPDYVEVEGNPTTASSKLNNPGYLYMLYYNNNLLGMNVLTEDNEITIDDYSIRFVDPQQYTLLQVKHDPYTWLAGIGAAVLLGALYLSFYVQTQECLITDGKVYARSRKGGVLFDEKVKEKIEKLEGEV